MNALNSALLSIRNLRISFEVQGEPLFAAVQGISFDIPQHSTVALVGESGSGKSVTALSILGLLPKAITRIDPNSEIVWQGQNLLKANQNQLRAVRGKDISIIFQEPMSSLNPVFTVGDQLIEGLRLHLGLSQRAAHARAVELLHEVGIAEPLRRMKAFPHQLSGGQQQRVMIAMAIGCEPKLLIADEPTTALDVTIQRQILDLIADLQQRLHMSVLFITHDLALVGEIANSVVVMKSGLVREAGLVQDVFHAPQDAYTRALLSCRPPLHARPHRLRVIDDFMNGGQTPMDRGLTPKPPKPSKQEILLDVRGVKKDFRIPHGLWGHRLFHAVKGATFQLARGETVGIVGESGSGKTTLGLVLMGLHAADGGSALFRGHDLLKPLGSDTMAMKRRIQIVFQNPYASLNPRFTVGQILTEPLMLHEIGENAAERESLVRQLLLRVGLPVEALYRYPHEFSGGQRQRIAIARCLTVKPEILICDESVSALDVSVQAQVLNLLKDLQDEYHMSYIFISHDLAVVRYMSDQMLVMSEGEVVEQGDADAVFNHPQHAYTQRLLAAIPQERQKRGQTPTGL
jgi:peptide/nickel transport system ATP-binding protein